MSIFFKIFGSTADTGASSGASATYATVRANTNAVSGGTNTTQSVGQTFSGGLYTLTQGYFVFDLSAVPAGGTAILGYNCSTAITTGTDTLEIRESSTATNKIAGASISALASLGSMAMPGTTGAKTLAITTPSARSATTYLLLSSANENANVAPTTSTERISVSMADTTGTTSDPYLQLTTGTAWTFINASPSLVAATATSHVLQEPSGAAQNDLIVACIASRIASTTSITLPSGWALVSEQKTNNTLTTGNAVASAMMAYIVRGSSAPSYTFTHPVAPSIALGTCMAYRNVNTSSPKDTQTSFTTAVSITAVSGTGLTTTQDDDLIVALCAGGQEAAWSAFNATDPGTSSGTTSFSSLDPIWGQWLEREDTLTTTGSDTSIAVYDAIKQTAGATGNLTATASVAASHAVVAGAFKLAPSGTTYNDAVAETAAAAETVDSLLGTIRLVEAGEDRITEAGEIRIIDESAVLNLDIVETAAAAETVASLLDATRAVAETAAAVETLAGQVTFTGAIAETAAAADTAGGLLVRIGALAETAAAAETAGGLLTVAGAIAETAAAAETVGGLFNVTGAVAETAAAAETLTGGLAFNITVAETTSAADTFTKTLSYTGALAETASAADTAGGLLVAIGAVAETTSAAETIGASVVPASGAFNEIVVETVSAADAAAGLLTFTGAIAETASATDTAAGLLTFTGAVAESASAAETLAGTLTFTGAVAETAAAAETISKSVSFTGAVAETLAAVETAGGLAIAVGAVADTAAAAETAAGLLSTASAIVESASAAETIVPTVVPAGGTLYEEAVLETLAANDAVAADVIPGEVVVPPLQPGGIGHGGKRRRHLFIYENVPADNDDDEEEPKPRPKRRLRLKKAEIREKVAAAVEWIEAGSPRPMSQQTLVAEVSTLLDIAALIEADRRRVERTIYRYVAALLAEEEEEEIVSFLLAA